MVGKDAWNLSEEFVADATKPKTMYFEDWIRIGYDNGWIGAPICYTHDGIPTTKEEDDAWVEGEDPCMHILRLYADEEMKRGVEENHSPSQWRASNQGL